MRSISVSNSYFSNSLMTPATGTPTPIKKPGWWTKLLFSYRWMSRRNKIALWGLIAVSIGVGVSFQWIKPAYKTWKMNYYMHLAEGLVQKKDYSAASLAYRKALLSDPDRPEAWKSLAKFLEQLDSPEVIGIWEKLAKIEPNVREHRYKQAAAAIKYGRAYEAEEIIDALPEEWRNDPAYLRSVVYIAIQKNQLGIAERALNHLLEVNPNDEQAKYDLALAHTKSPDASVRYQAKRDLGEIAAGNSSLASTALRQSINIALEDKDNAEADRLASKLILLPDATVRDRLLHAQLELTSQSLTAPLTIKNLREYALTHSDSFEAIVGWFLGNSVDSEGTAKWLKELPPDFTSKLEVQSGLLQFYLSIADFKQVFRILRERSESLNIPLKVLDLAEKAINQLDDEPAAANRIWLEAVYAVESNPQALYYLSLVASARGWTGATGRTLSALADSAPSQAGVWNLLAKHESSAGNLPGYYKALGGLMRINPYDIHVASDWVIASVLLRKGDSDEVINIAKRTYDATEPADPWAGTAYAMALLRQRRPQQALEIMNRMTESNRLLPQRAIYVGAILAAAGRKQEALEYFARSEKFKDNNFPEEIALRRIWKGVALGEATTAEESERLLSTRKDLRAESHRIEMELRDKLKKRANPAEVQQILSQLKAASEPPKQAPPEVRQFMQELRAADAKRPSPLAVPSHSPVKKP